MSPKEMRLRDLCDEIYNAEDCIDGCYNSQDSEYSDLTEVNEKYNNLIRDMNSLVDLLRTEIELEENKED
jgi:hypothetical protein